MPFIALDEPASAMQIPGLRLGRFRGLAKGRTALLITHRWTTAMLADEILIMEDGRIVESGLDSQLIARGGRCSEWWALQKIQ